MIRLAAIAVLACGALGRSPSARAQTVVPTYPPGWNMIGAPTGSHVGGVASLYAYGPSGYVAADNTDISSCVGYFAYVPSGTELIPHLALVNDPLSRHGLGVPCPLQKGWNLVGNPLNNVALLPADTTGFWWDPQAQAYHVVQEITWGGAIWVYSLAASTLMLTGA